MQVVGICRFSLLGKGDWKAFRDKSDEEVQAILDDRAGMLFDPVRLEARLRSFEHLTLASLRAQSDQDFHFIVLASRQMPEEYKARLRALCAGVPQVTLRFFPVTMAHRAQRRVFRALGFDYSRILQFRLDDDDCLCRDFVALMKAHTFERMQGDGVFVASLRNVMYSAIGGPLAGVYHWPVEFMSAGAAIRHPGKSIYQFGHFGMARRFPNVVIDGHLALVTNNGMNDTRLTRKMIRRRSMERMSGAGIDRAIRDFFPFLSAEGRAIAGLDPAG
ncbi:glycosyltransferase [Pontibaca methylaminivorans]|uniref:glycosyltransferase n=1 Tax=Pontibaca methylaminivorans TaxID=515897 RepID=UPI002FDB6AF4